MSDLCLYATDSPPDDPLDVRDYWLYAKITCNGNFDLQPGCLLIEYEKDYYWLLTKNQGGTDALAGKGQLRFVAETVKA